MLVHGDQDFIPIQQAEEFFTALYRHDKLDTVTGNASIFRRLFPALRSIRL
jgi:hypothetical protein